MKEKILQMINNNVNGNNMIGYNEDQLEDLVSKIANELDKQGQIIVAEISIEKYTIYFNSSEIIKGVDTTALNSKEEFAGLIYNLFK